MQHATCNMQHARRRTEKPSCTRPARFKGPGNMQHATCNMQHATCNMQHATCNMRGEGPRSLRARGQHASKDQATCNMQHATCNMQHATCNMQHATCVGKDRE